MAEILRPVPQVDLKMAEQSDGSMNSSSVGDTLKDDLALDRRLLWRRDLVLVPIMGILYTLLFLDRTNIANARALGIGSPTGLEGALHMPPNGFNIALVIFYIPFVLAEIPANLVLNLNKIKPRYFLGGQMCLLGILGMCQGLVQNYGGLLAVRFLMGAFEASLPAGATYMISTYYTKRDAALRFAWFFNFALAGPFFSGLLAYAIQRLEGTGGYQGWRWLFIIEGLMTVFISVFIVLFCPNFPHEAQSWFLKPHERDRIVSQLEASRGAETKGSAVDDVPIWKVLVDWRIHLFTMCFFCCDVTAASVSAFSPTILTELGWTSTVAQLMTMPIWASGIIASFVVTYISSRVNLRTPFILGAICFQLIGWIIMRVYVPHAGVRYMALFFMSVGTFPQMPILMGWLSANLRGRKYLAVGMAWMIGFGNCANFISSNVFIRAEAPRYQTGFTTGLVFTVVGFFLVSSGCALLVVKNQKRETARASMSDAERERHDELYFKFVL
ncbi:major facilitator superfamily domain-containing protein [Pseudomassariella vexata]|uniref:Major facilitator superfamily domain-containing protein n=1 Tax=Pseudomassariella vexata TaxID=1141098 RepID=A0A1Y2E3D6_9PEZI|nr:major facilitator superfamily domain-containing protein [Pseudomassariella vexata]ORY66071.1 major facilitator superfamily domain-containing protein [Pseudomassariella vexata]